MLDPLADRLLEPLAASFTETPIPVRIANVVEVQAIHIVPAGNFEHGFDLKFLVRRMGRTQPPLVDRTVITDLHAAQ